MIDGTGAPPQPGVTIVMEGGRIRDIGPSRAAACRRRDRDRSRRQVRHARHHQRPRPCRAADRDPQLRQYALYGVTTTTSMALDPDDMQEFKARRSVAN